MISMTFGEMPTRDQFDSQFQRFEDQNGIDLFRFGDDKRLGNCSLTRNELWAELEKVHAEYSTLLADDGEDDPEDVGQWLSCVLEVLGFEWI
jgi:hypothetical protein